MTSTLESSVLQRLMTEARRSARGRCHLLLHNAPTDPLQEMLVAARSSTYIRPHQHQQRVESLLVLRGQLVLVLFNEYGRIASQTTLSPVDSGGTFFARIEARTWHTLVVRTDEAVFLESKPGPFRPEETVVAQWSPEDGDSDGIRRFRAAIARAADDTHQS